MVVYKITNLVNKKVYIGQTIQSIKDRLNHHFRANKATPLYRAHLKYGRESFSIEVIDTALTIDELNEKEIYWIEFYKSTEYDIGYNLMSGGGNKGRHSEESKKKMSETHKANMTDERKQLISERTKEGMTEEVRKRLSEIKAGIKQSPELIEKRAAARIGYKWTEESKRKSSETQKGRKKSPEQIEKVRKALLGRKRTPEAIEKTAAANRGRKATPEQREKYRKAALLREAKRRENRES